MNQQILGCEIETTTHNSQKLYMLHGPRGAHYGLIRNAAKPDMLKAMNMKNSSQPVSIQGYSWFSDKSGELVAVA